MKNTYFLTIPFFLIFSLTHAQDQIGQTLTEFATNDTFGASVAMNDAGDRILTSAPRFDS